ILMTDPKNEIEYWFSKALRDPDVRTQYESFTELVKMFHYITLDPSDADNWGVLDPICFLGRMQANENAQAIINQIYDLDNKDEVKTEALKAISDVTERRQRGEV